ncbi:phosphopyruvate hydratase [Candidatus Parcubacteria bacterium]|nr:phosphopyruvate hydratase [Candidatus Parcubacteria bacterium]
MKITKIIAREVLDSRGNPTVEAKVFAGSLMGRAMVPSGASTGTHEALELRDGGKRYNGKGVLRAVENVNTKIARKLKGMDVCGQIKIDEAMLRLDGTKNKSALGANAILAVSLACARLGAEVCKIPLYKYINKTFSFGKMSMPIAMMNILNGGRHANFAADFQEFMILPKANKLSERVRIGSEVFHSLKEILKKKKMSTGVGDEGGFAPQLPSNEDGFKLILEAIKKAGYTPGKNVNLAIDAAASEFYTNKKYNLRRDNMSLKAEGLLAYYIKIAKKYPLVSIEDGFAEDDWGAWQKWRAIMPGIMQVGDDIFVTNTERLQKGIDMKVANAILIKVNQIGTLSETIDAIKLAQKNKYKIIISHRSGTTCDTFIADLSVATGAEYIKTGSLSRSERISKYNRLMEIEEEITN